MNRILLLEDDEALGRGICMALETPDCTVTHCGTRRQATDILQNMVFDLLILDINLPDGSGLALLLTLVLGPVAFRAVEGLFWFFTYRMNLTPFLLIIPLFALLGAGIPALTVRAAKRRTIVERLRME